ncbi:MAG: hypothetical protein LBN21_03850 [Treponema sp.]|jgi:hypothetical protein|nr:hypothetical protein [Treponema sp.]
MKRQQIDEACFGCMNTKCAKRFVPVETGEGQDGSGQQNNTPAKLVKEALKSILPLAAGFIAGFFLTQIIFPEAGDPARAAGGALCLFASGLGFYFIKKSRKKR